MNYFIQHRRGTKEEWAAKGDIIPKEAEIVVELDEVNGNKFKIGDGITPYKDLPYATKNSGGNIPDGDFSDIEELLNGKVDKVEGKDLSTNDFTDEYKNKLDSFEIDDENNITANNIITAKDFNIQNVIDVDGAVNVYMVTENDYYSDKALITSKLPIIPGTLSFAANLLLESDEKSYHDDSNGNIIADQPESIYTKITVDYNTGIISYDPTYGYEPSFSNISYKASKFSDASLSNNIASLNKRIEDVKNSGIHYIDGTKDISIDIAHVKDISIDYQEITGSARVYMETEEDYISYGAQITSKLPIIPGTLYFESNFQGWWDTFYKYEDDGEGNIIRQSDKHISGTINYESGWISYYASAGFEPELINIKYKTSALSDPSLINNILGLEEKDVQLKTDITTVNKELSQQISTLKSTTADLTTRLNKLDIVQEALELPETGESKYIYVIPKDQAVFTESKSIDTPIYEWADASLIFDLSSFKPDVGNSVDIYAKHILTRSEYRDPRIHADYVKTSGEDASKIVDSISNHITIDDVKYIKSVTIYYSCPIKYNLDDYYYVDGYIEGDVELKIIQFNKEGDYSKYLWANNQWEELSSDVDIDDLNHPVRVGVGNGSVIISDPESTSQANGRFSLSQGYYTHSNGNYTHSEGNGGYAIGDYSHNEGYRTRTNELASHAEGQESIADGRYSHAEGKSTNAVGYSAHSEGISTVATGNHSHSEGANTKTIGQASHTEGNNTKTFGLYSHAEGQFGAAVGESAHIEGWSYYIPEDGYNKYAEEIGMSSITSISDVSAPELEKVWRVPETKTGKAPEWRFAVAQGKFSHVEGENGLAIGPFTHTEGHMNVAKGIGSHAEGIYTETVGKQSHSEGSNTSTQGRASHAEGIRTIASGKNTHTEGAHSVAGSTTIGEIYNKSGKPLFRENSYSATTTQANYVSGSVTANDEDNGLIITLSNNSFFSTHYNSIIVLDGNTYKTYVSQVLSYDSTTRQLVLANDTTGLPVGRAVRVFTTYTGLPSEDFNKIVEYTESNLCTTIKLDKVFIGNEASELLLKVGSNYYIAHVLSADWSNEDFTFITIDRLITEITNNVSTLEIHIADNEVTGAHAEGHGTWAAAEYSHSEGSNTVARAIGSHAEGKQSITMGEYCHAEGSDTKAGGHWTHTEGSGTYTEGYASHAEGVSTKAIASPSHAEGTGTIADETNLTVVGKYNVPKASRSKNALFIVGNGSSASATSDAFRVFTDGTIETSTIKMLPDGTIETPYVTIDANFSTSGVPAKEWLNEKWILFGDSLTASTSINGTDMNGKRYFELIAKKTGITIDNKAVSGTGYKRQSDEKTGNTSGVAANAFWNVASTLESSDTDSPVITLFGSGNDLLHFSNLGSSTDTDTTTICGCINKTLDTIYEKLPLARVCVVTPTPWKNSEPNKTTCHMSQYVDKLIEICHLRGIPCLDLYHNSALRPQDDNFRASAYCEDAGTHPNAIGHKLIAPRFKAMLDTLII